MTRMYNRFGWIADPAPPEWGTWWEQLTKEQQQVIMSTQIDQQIRETQFEMDSLKAQLETLQTMKSMMKTKG